MRWRSIHDPDFWMLYTYKNRWLLRRTRARRAHKAFDDRREAVSYAKKYVRERKGRLSIHNKWADVVWFKDYSLKAAKS